MLNITELLKVICNEIELNEWKDKTNDHSREM